MVCFFIFNVRLASGRNVDDLTGAAVATYIKDQGLHLLFANKLINQK